MNKDETKVQAARRGENRRVRWAAEARSEWALMMAKAPNECAGATRARAVMRLAKQCAMPDQWSALASAVAFLLPGDVQVHDMDAPATVGLKAAAAWLIGKGAPCAEDFASRVAAMAGVLVVDLRPKPAPTVAEILAREQIGGDADA